MIRNVNNRPPPSLGIGCIVHLRQPLKYHHIASECYQVDVGSLNHAFKIQGSVGDSELAQSDRDSGNCKNPEYDASWTYIQHNLLWIKKFLVLVDIYISNGKVLVK
jgi:hypothetical protein